MLLIPQWSGHSTPPLGINPRDSLIRTDSSTATIRSTNGTTEDAPATITMTTKNTAIEESPATTKDLLEKRWQTFTTANFETTDQRSSHRYKAGTIISFDCSIGCSVSFSQGRDVIMTKEGPGHMSVVPADVSIVARDGYTKAVPVDPVE
ncbi:hypothetical protein EDB80DRAFT_267009 [Ilyonectria destructans]|nr:hypothetical protein EDB80DRAFT_267009 [Ilyonectria destructans]